MHEENRHEIGKLKDAIAELSTSLAVNREVTKGLKEVIEREFVRHVDERKSIESRLWWWKQRWIPGTVLAASG
jgi:hypothetical protein